VSRFRKAPPGVTTRGISRLSGAKFLSKRHRARRFASGISNPQREDPASGEEAPPGVTARGISGLSGAKLPTFRPDFSSGPRFNDTQSFEEFFGRLIDEQHHYIPSRSFVENARGAVIHFTHVYDPFNIDDKVLNESLRFRDHATTNAHEFRHSFTSYKAPGPEIC